MSECGFLERISTIRRRVDGNQKKYATALWRTLGKFWKYLVGTRNYEKTWLCPLPFRQRRQHQRGAGLRMRKVSQRGRAVKLQQNLVVFSSNWVVFSSNWVVFSSNWVISSSNLVISSSNVMIFIIKNFVVRLWSRPCQKAHLSEEQHDQEKAILIPGNETKKLATKCSNWWKIKKCSSGTKNWDLSQKKKLNMFLD